MKCILYANVLLVGERNASYEYGTQKYAVDGAITRFMNVIATQEN